MNLNKEENNEENFYKLFSNYDFNTNVYNLNSEENF